MTEIKKYFAFFKIRFSNSLQYRAAALGGLATQFVWGFMYINMYLAFYKSDPSAFPMGINELVSYIWLQQAFFAVLNFFRYDNTIIEGIKTGDVALELIRPVNIYGMWFSKDIASRIAAGTLRFAPVILIAVFLPAPYNFAAPHSVSAFLLFLISLSLAVILLISINMLVYISGFYTVNMDGIRLAVMIVGGFFSGLILPLAFFPSMLSDIASVLPFGLCVNFPLNVYSGNIMAESALVFLALQIFWIVVLQFIGRTLIKHALKKLVVQGG